MIRLLVIEIDIASSFECGSCRYAKPTRSPDFCELFGQQSQNTGASMYRVNDCITAERRFLDPAWRQGDLAGYEHPRNEPKGSRP